MKKCYTGLLICGLLSLVENSLYSQVRDPRYDQGSFQAQHSVDPLFGERGSYYPDGYGSQSRYIDERSYPYNSRSNYTPSRSNYSEDRLAPSEMPYNPGYMPPPPS
jgi:hypothetical protein